MFLSSWVEQGWGEPVHDLALQRHAAALQLAASAFAAHLAERQLPASSSAPIQVQAAFKLQV